MYLSRLSLSPHATQSDSYWRLLGTPYRLHQETWRVFGDGPDTERDFIYRFDEARTGPVIYGLSPRPAKDSEGLWDIQSKEYTPKLIVGNRLSYRIRINPTRSRDGKRHDVVMDAKHRARQSDSEDGMQDTNAILQREVQSWLTSRAESGGFESESLLVDGYRVHEFKKSADAKPIRHATCDLEGILKVADPHQFLDLVYRGLGPSKAFGCGLFLLRRV